MYAFEELAGGYFAVIAGAAPFAPARGYRRATAAVTALLLVGLVAVAAAYGGDPVRMGLPVAYLIAGYWLPALLVADADVQGTAPASPFERWLRRSDHRLRARLFTVPRPLRELVELAYLLCYPLVPASFAIVWMLGTPDDVDRFWLAVMTAGFACYVSLPWLVSRPPRSMPTVSSPLECRTQATNVKVLRRVSHQFITFPSGHVAVALAAAAAVAAVAPAAGALVGVMAAAIAIGAGAGGYHYVVDVIAGVVVAGIVALAFL
jgi:membrane-associated phospholipid phosphatase